MRHIGKMVVMLSIMAAPAGAEIVGYQDGWRLERFPIGCIMTAKAQQGGGIALAIRGERPEAVVVTLFDSSWQSLKAGQTYPLVVSIGGDKQAVDAVATTYEDQRAIQFRVSRSVLMASARSNLSVIRDGHVLTGWKFYHDDVAFHALAACGGAANDPFAG